jgi:hypothetical protein
MEYKGLVTVSKKEKVDDLYDLTLPTFVYNKEVLEQNLQRYITTEDDEMRIDIICDKIYGSTEHVDFLMELNNITNPLLIKKEMEIKYVSENLIPSFVKKDTLNDNVRKTISNKRKATKVDSDRNNYNSEKSQNIPPTVTKKDYNPVKYQDGKIRIGENIFKV